MDKGEWRGMDWRVARSAVLICVGPKSSCESSCPLVEPIFNPFVLNYSIRRFWTRYFRWYQFVKHSTWNGKLNMNRENVNILQNRTENLVPIRVYVKL